MTARVCGAARRATQHARQSAEAEHGFTLPELLVVLLILGIILGGITQLFVASTRAQTDQTNRVNAQQEARLALDRMRREAHCASTLSYSATSVTLTLPYYCRTAPTATLNGTIAALPAGTITVASTLGFNSGSNTISIGSSGTITCAGPTSSTQFTNCTGGTGGPYLSGAKVASTTSTTATWCVPPSGAGSSQPYALRRYVGACGSATGVTWGSALVSSSLFSSPAVPAAALTASSGGTLAAGPYSYDVTAVLPSGVEVPGTVASTTIASGLTNKISVSWTSYAGASSYNVYGRDANGLRLLKSTTSTSYVDTGPTSLNGILTLPKATIPVVDTSNFNPGANAITFGASGVVNCTGTTVPPTAPAFTGCSSGQAGQYASGTPVFNASTARPPLVTLSVSLIVDETPADAKQRFTVNDDIVLRNSRPF